MWTYVFISLGYISRSGISVSYGNCVQVFEELSDYFPKQEYHFIFLLAVDEDSSFSASSPTQMNLENILSKNI